MKAVMSPAGTVIPEAESIVTKKADKYQQEGNLYTFISP